MNVSPNKILLILMMTAFISGAGFSQQSATELTDFNTLSEKFLLQIKEGKSTKEIREQLANTTLEALEDNLTNDEQKLAFWVNIYNAYIQVILSENPDLYNDRRDFFSREQIPIAGEMVSFAKIEHGIIRKSQWPLGLGFIRKWFPNKFERKLRVEKRDYRVHFALNCGAKDCPPVAIYKGNRLNEQFTKGTTNYLSKTSTYHKTNNEAEITSLFSWFRGDFGGKKGVKKILKKQEIIPSTKGVTITYKNYDWTLDLNNWTKL